MPNYKLGSSIRENIVRNAKLLTNRRLDYASLGFPLTHDEVQGALIDQETLGHIGWLRGMHPDIQAGSRTTHMWVRLDGGYLPELQRGMTVLIVSPHPFETVHGSRNPSARSWDRDCDNTRPLDNEALTNEQRAKLAAWGNRVVREARLKQVTDTTVGGVVNSCASVAHIQAWWPTLATLVDDNFWVARFRNPPKNIHKLAPPETNREAWAARIKAADAVLTSAQMMPKFETPKDVVTASMGTWRPLRNDPVFT